MFQSVINRAALGRAANIGSLYDVRTESFLHDSLFESKVDDSSIDKMELGDTSIELVMSDNIQEKFNKLNIEAELQVSFLAGLVKLSGSGSYLNDVKKSARSQNMSLIYKIRTVNEEFLLRQNRGKIDTAVLTSVKECGTSATHVVVGIDWGAVCSITCEYENSENKDETEVKGALQGVLEKMKSLVSAKGSVADTDENKTTTFTFKCKSDVSSTSQDLPTTFEGALQLAKSLPSLIKDTNDGKGVPVLYMLMPLDAVVKMCKLQISLEICFRPIAEDTIKRTTQVVEKMAAQSQRFHDIQVDLHRLSDYVSEKTLVKIDKYVDEISIETAAFRMKLQALLKQIRRHEADLSELETFLCRSLGESSQLSTYEAQIREFDKEFNKVNDIKAWKARGIVYFGKNDRFVADDAHTVYVFYKPKEDTKRNVQMQEFFLRCHKTSGNQRDIHFKVIDETVRADLWTNEGRPVIVVYTNGVKVCGDLYEKEGRDTEMCLMKHHKATPCRYKPVERANVKIRCPNSVAGNGQCSGSPITWKCVKCKEVVEYGLKTLAFYCKCGESVPSASAFRCNESGHGIDYVQYPDDTLRDELSYLRAMKETNILILGETGVGKSTWINGIVNYLSFADLNEAKDAEDYFVLIPSEFTFTKDGKSLVIKMGKANDNEILQAGHSATQETRSYIFHVGDQKIRLIDTPGIGDSRGLEQDRKNFDNILAYLSYYEEIHAVCILLKPNNSRLTAMFRFCIQELLARLHTSAKDNIVFCFTNARATFYQPGDTLPALNKMLDDKQIGISATPHNYYCFDNEPFRFLACLHNGVTFGDEDIRTYAASWDRAVSETNRLFGQINLMPPHKVRNTISMNEARRVILAMSKPMAEVAKTIQENVQTANEAKQQIDLHRNDMSNLQKQLQFKGVDLVREELPYPTTVCAHGDCIERLSVGQSNIQKVNYKQVCHSHCNLSGIPTETTNDSRLQSCWCINGTNCHQCGHHYTHHMHLTYTLEKVEKVFISKEVQKQILSKASLTEQKEALKRSIDSKVNELQSEETTILHISAKYGAFLKENAIIPYNDAVGDYLDLSIKQEEDKADLLRNKEFLTRLQELKEEYEKEKQILDRAIAQGEETTPEQVMQLQRQLFELKHFGATLKRIFDGISISRSVNGMQFQETVAPFNQNVSRHNVGQESGATKMVVMKRENWLRRKWNNFWK